jgi:hypothetical protein
MVVGYQRARTVRASCDFDEPLEQLRVAVEQLYVERVSVLEERPRFSHLTSSDSGGASVITGRTRLGLLNEALNGFGLKRSKGQRGFHRNMTMAVIHKLFRDDFAEHIDFLREQFKTDKFKPEVMIITPRRFGKCLGPDDKILLANGGTRRAADVRVGDLLVGDDGLARIVMNTCSGRAPMFRVNDAASTPSEDAAFTCNDAHLLVFEMRGQRATLRRNTRSFQVVERNFDQTGKLCIRETATSYRLEEEEQARAHVASINALGTATVTLRAADVYAQLRATDSTATKFTLPPAFASVRRRVDAFPLETKLSARLVGLGVDPLDAAYYAGVWLGDGTTIRTNEITACVNSSPEIIEFLERFAADNGLFLTRTPDARRPNVIRFNLSTTDAFGKKRRANNIADKNPVQQALLAMGVGVADKSIGSTLMGSSREARLQLLAGLLDTDGYYEKKSGAYEVVQKRRSLALDIVRLARSLGLCATIHDRVISGTSYARVNISGATDTIPCRLKRKQAASRTLGRDYNRYTTSIEALGDGEYYGFQCAAVTDESRAEEIAAGIAAFYAAAGDSAVADLAARLVHVGALVPSLADGGRAPNGCYPGRFLLANHTVVHNTYSVAMFVAACAYAIDGSDQAIFSTGRRASKKLLDLIYRFLCKLPGMKEAIIVHNVETIHIQGPGGPDDVRKISSYPSKVRLLSSPPPPPVTNNNERGVGGGVGRARRWRSSRAARRTAHWRQRRAHRWRTAHVRLECASFYFLRHLRASLRSCRWRQREERLAPRLLRRIPGTLRHGRWPVDALVECARHHHAGAARTLVRRAARADSRSARAAARCRARGTRHCVARESAARKRTHTQRLSDDDAAAHAPHACVSRARARLATALHARSTQQARARRRRALQR